ncbi:MAG: hypothetical protein A2928_00890 [Candidatus Taylorbacteria bacterium RIFCSPLOWO2_01_FULL_45_15b]|uniref:Uncharacterized protein n=1 Tax=Candidatus Taylorbacteria bacterium RIFCSPLOWO2_01_FULL_45_15b TaxID=1802319 RepID=A0A1G2NA83_9BACT|nr:MAG: hypothetical protein A2928_00890 [Candidatus Taylorbacteria bacterium RIFCSPLOWO2_01_FULL_45_15b]
MSSTRQRPFFQELFSCSYFDIHNLLNVETIVFSKQACDGIPSPNLLPRLPSEAVKNFSPNGFALFSEYPTDMERYVEE